jgi:hypothetical protein
MKIADAQLYAVLASILEGNGTARVRPRDSRSSEYDVEVTLELEDTHRGDSPDLVLWLRIAIKAPQLPVLKITVPIPIEGEKAGIGAALEDLRKFGEREHFPFKLPMLVVGGEGNPARRYENLRAAVKVEIIQIPYRQVANLA